MSISPEGEAARFEVTVGGIPKPEVTWLRNNFPIPQSEEFQSIVEGDKCSLVIKDTHAEDSGLYTARVQNLNGSASCSAELIVGK